MKVTDERYGIWITTQWWATVDGGPDDVGTREKMEALAAEYTAEIPPGQIIKYEVRPYVEPPPISAAQSYEFTMRELLRHRKQGTLSQDTEESYAVILSDYRKQMTDEEQTEIAKKIALAKERT